MCLSPGLGILYFQSSRSHYKVRALTLSTGDIKYLVLIIVLHIPTHILVRQFVSGHCSESRDKRFTFIVIIIAIIIILN